MVNAGLVDIMDKQQNGTNIPAVVEERSCQDDEDPIFPRFPPLKGSRVVEFARTPVPLFAPLRLSSTAPAASVPPSSLLVSSGRSSERFAADAADVGCCSRYSKSSTESDVGCLSLLPVHRLMSSQPRVRDRVVDNKEVCTAVDPFNTGSSWPGNAAINSRSLYRTWGHDDPTLYPTLPAVLRQHGQRPFIGQL